MIAQEDPGHPDWVSTAGHPHGRIWFCWFLPDRMPSRPTATVVPLTSIVS